MGDFTADVNGDALKALRKKIDDLRNPLTKRQAQDIATGAAKEMKDLISKGISPIAGKGRFPAYRGGYRKQIKKTGKIEGKPKKLRPVNLKVTGAFLKNLKGRTRRKGRKIIARVGYTASSARIKEQEHREGANKQAKRPTIPSGSEQFAASILVKVIKIVDKAVAKIVKRPLK